MKHRVKQNQLGRNKKQNKALRRSLLSALFISGRIETTLPKAKAIVTETDRILTFAKRNDVSARREVIKILGSDEILDRVFNTVAPMTGSRTSGFTRIIKLGQRFSDSTPMAVMELVDFKVQEMVVKEPVKAELPEPKKEVEVKEKPKAEKIVKEKVQRVKPQTTQRPKAIGNK